MGNESLSQNGPTFPDLSPITPRISKYENGAQMERGTYDLDKERTKIISVNKSRGRMNGVVKRSLTRPDWDERSDGRCDVGGYVTGRPVSVVLCFTQVPERTANLAGWDGWMSSVCPREAFIKHH